MKRAIIYTRVSTDEQADKGYSLNYQEAQLRKYCDINKIEIAVHFIEDYSAKNFERPEYKKLMQYARNNKGKIDFLLFTKWDRFSRNIADSYEMIKLLDKMKIEPQAIEQPLDYKIPQNISMLALYLSIPEVDNKIRAQNVKNGMRRANKEGRYLGPAPRGFKNARDVFDKPIIVQNEEARFIKEAFELVGSGIYTQSDVISLLKQKGFQCSKTQFSLLLQNRLYAGKVFLRSSGSEADEWVNGIHEPIISEEQFNKTQDILVDRRDKTKRLKAKCIDEHLPLRGFIVCTGCGNKYTGSQSHGNGGGYRYYHCNNCKQRVRADVLNDDMVQLLGRIQIEPELKELYSEIIRDLLKGDDVERKSEIKRLDAEVSKQKERINSLTDKLADGLIDSMTYSEAKKRYGDIVNQMEQERINLSMVKTEFDQYLQWGLCLLENVQYYYVNNNASVKQKIIGSIFTEKFEIQENKLRTVKLNELVGLVASAGVGFRENKTEQLIEKNELFRLVPGTGIEPVQPQWPQDFKSFGFLWESII
jgi:DNA invertase Pin-like site-specific DNA recombinase